MLLILKEISRENFYWAELGGASRRAVLLAEHPSPLRGLKFTWGESTIDRGGCIRYSRHYDSRLRKPSTKVVLKLALRKFG